MLCSRCPRGSSGAVSPGGETDVVLALSERSSGSCENEFHDALLETSSGRSSGSCENEVHDALLETSCGISSSFLEVDRDVCAGPGAFSRQQQRRQVSTRKPLDRLRFLSLA